MTDTNFSKIVNTLTSVSAINDSVTTLSLAGNNPVLPVDSTVPVNLLLSTTNLLQATSTQLIINNNIGNEDITLVFINNTFTLIEQAAAIQRVLNLNIVGATARLNITRIGGGGSPIVYDGRTLLGTNQFSASILVEAANVDEGTEINVFSTVASIPGPYITGVC